MKKATWITGATLMLLTACSQPDAPVAEVAEENSATTSVESSSQALVLLEFSESANAFHELATMKTKAMLSACATLQRDIQSFLVSPSDETQIQAQNSFLPCYQAWTNNALFFQQPMDLSDKKTFNTLVDLIDTRPFLPGYIDGIPEYPFSGLVHELDMPVNAGNLRSQHRLMDEESASVGFPVIEFFLWKVPADVHWQENDDNANVVERRRDYLNVASELLMEQLTQAVVRWQENNHFSELPERAQMSYILKSMQRLTMVELLADQFEESALNEPEYHHSALLSGHGRAYPLSKLKGIQDYLGTQGDTAFGKWLSKSPQAPVDIATLRQSLADTITAIEQLPTNYPIDSTADENWQNARQQLAQLTLHFSNLSQHFQVAIVTD